MEPLLSGLRVVELSERPAGWYAGSMFALLGAQVTAFRRPGAKPPVRYFHLDHGKQALEADWSNDEGVERVRGAVAQADVFLTTLPPAQAEARGLTHERLSRENGRLVYVALTPFGLDGPYRDYQADELVLEALMGLMDLTGDPGREPLKLGGEVIEQVAGLTAFVAAETALLHRDAGAGGQLVDVSMLEAAVSIMEHSPAIWTHLGIVRKRVGNWGALAGWGLYPTLDGFAGIISGLGETYQRFRRHIGGALLEPEFEDIGARTTKAAEMNAAIIAYTSGRTKAEVYEAGQRDRLPFGYVCTVPELLESSQLAARAFFEELPAPDGTPVRVPGLPFRLTDGPGATASRRKEPRMESSRPLEGVRVIDLGVVWAGPHGTRLLADMGAEVLKVEGPDAFDPIRGPREPPSRRAGVYPNGEPGERPYNRHGYFNERNRNKLGLTIDLKREEGRALLLELVAVSDVLIENFAVGTMDRLGLGYEAVAAARPDLVYLSMPAFGNTGPESRYVGFGATNDQLSGLVSLTGYGSDDLQSPGINVSDPIAGTHGAGAVLAALIARAKTGRGCLIDLSHREATARLLAPQLIEYQLTGQSPGPLANGHAEAVPHGCYPCAGDDRWLALSVSSDDEWRAASGILGIDDARFDAEAGRRSQAVELDAAISARTRECDAEELMRLLQEAGVRAGDVRSADRLYADAQLRARDFFQLVEHPEAGAHEILGRAWKLPAVDLGPMTPAPCLGQHNREVLRRVLGYTKEKIAALETDGVIGAPESP